MLAICKYVQNTTDVLHRKESNLTTFIEIVSCNYRIRVTCIFGVIAKKLLRGNKINGKSIYNGIYSKADRMKINSLSL
jgi:hypothetical protein